MSEHLIQDSLLNVREKKNNFQNLDQLPRPWIEQQEQQLESQVSVHPSLHPVNILHTVTTLNIIAHSEYILPGDYIAPSENIAHSHNIELHCTRLQGTTY